MLLILLIVYEDKIGREVKEAENLKLIAEKFSFHLAF